MKIYLALIISPIRAVMINIIKNACTLHENLKTLFELIAGLFLTKL